MKYYPHEIRAMLRRARDLGYSLGPGSWLERLTIGELAELVKKGQRKK